MDGQGRDDAPVLPAPVVGSFATDLDDMFGLSSEPADVGQLEQTVEEKKQNVNSGHAQLQELEAKLRETEHRLSLVSRGNSPARQADVGAARTAPEQSAPTTSTMSPGAASGASPLAQKPAFPADRPPTGGRPQNTREDTQALMSGMPGAMPQTPMQYSGNSGDYVMVDRSGGRSVR